MDTRSMMGFLKALEENNERDWFHANKGWYQEASGTFESLVAMLMLAVQSFDANIPVLPAKELTFRLMRDTRFSHDKRPYNPSFRAHIGRAGKKPIPCDYYISLMPGDRSFLGGGLFASVFSDATRLIRDAIAADGEGFLAAVEASGLEVKGEALKRVPKEYDPSLPQAEYLKNKSWYLEAPAPDALLYDPDAFVEAAAQRYRRMMPLNAFLNRALEGFVLPQRPRR